MSGLETGCFAVIFTSLRAEGHEDEYGRVSKQMDEMAATMPGYLGVETARGADGIGINVSYWATLDDVKHWKEMAEHDWAQQRGRDVYYEWYRVRIAKVERAYAFAKGSI